MRKTITGLLSGVTLMAGILLVVAPMASALEGKPLAFSKFTMQLTERTDEIPLGESPGEGEHYEFVNEPYKLPFTQAGGHPWGLTTTFEFATETNSAKLLVPTRDAKDVVASLPAGLLGDPMAVPRCSLAFVTSVTSETECPADTQVGVYHLSDSGGKELLLRYST